MTKELQKYLLQIARQAIAMELGLKVEGPVLPENLSDEEKQLLNEKRGVFVTLEIDGRLRGCIGNILPAWNLFLAVKRNAVAAAFEDPRFSPLSKSELADLDIEISVLSLPIKLRYDGPDDLLEKLESGRDGVIIKKGYYEATYLPQVWEDIPDKEIFLSSLCMKAGLNAQEWITGGLLVSTYTVEAFKEEKIKG